MENKTLLIDDVEKTAIMNKAEPLVESKQESHKQPEAADSWPMMSMAWK
jgi:hypothetical protein